MLIGEVEQRAARLGRVHGAGRVVGIDDDERARGRRDQALEVIEVRHPSARRVEPVVLRGGVELREHRGVERIGGHRHEHFAARVDHGAQGELDAFRRAGGDEHAIGGDRKTVPRVLLGHRFPRGRDPGRRPVVVVTVPHRPLDRGNEVRRRLEAEGDRVADVEVADAGARRFHLLRFRDDVADGVGKAVHAGGRLNGCLSFRDGHRAILLGTGRHVHPVTPLEFISSKFYAHRWSFWPVPTRRDQNKYCVCNKLTIWQASRTQDVR